MRGTAMQQPMRLARSAGRRWLAWGMPACLAMSLLEAWQGRALFPEIPARAFWSQAISRTLPSWIALGLLVPLVVLWAGYLHERRHAKWSVVAGHALGGMGFVLTHLGISAWAVRFTTLPHTAMQEFRHLIGTYATADLFSYLTIAGFAHAHLAHSMGRAFEQRAASLREGLARAELAELRAQLDPHFLFNALNAVVGLAERADFSGVCTAVDRLSSLLRRSLDARQRPYSALEEEVAFATDYLALQRLRYAERLEYEVDMPEELREVCVPALLLQPLVENAVRHAMSPAGSCTRVRITAERSALGVRLRVLDNGPGFAATRGRLPGHGIGLENTRRRLKSYYGARQRLTCSDAPEGGASVELDFPIEGAPS